MWSVSQTYTTLMNSAHFFEYSVAFGSTTAANGYKEDDLIKVEAEYKVFSEEQPSIGGCLASELSVEMFTPPISIPRMAKVRPYIRVSDGETYSEWVPQGVYFIDTRESTKNGDGLDVFSFHAYDGMMKTESKYPSTTHNWPYSDINVVNEIAATIGAGVDSRTTSLLTKGYMVGAPVGRTMREVLGDIACYYAGNWIMNYDGELLLVQLNGLPVQPGYLVDEHGGAITFGGVRIIV